MGFSRQEYWSGLPFPSSGHLPDPGFEPGPPALQANSLPSEPPAKLLGMLEGGYSAPITLAQLVQEWQDWVSFFESNSIILQRKPKPRKGSRFLWGHPCVSWPGSYQAVWCGESLSPGARPGWWCGLQVSQPGPLPEAPPKLTSSPSSLGLVLRGAYLCPYSAGAAKRILKLGISCLS